jgi:hypothetical protein
VPVLVSAQDLATHLDQTVNREPAEQILTMVEAAVMSEYGSDIPPAADRPLQLLRQAILSAAVRVYTNPTGLISETIADYSYRREESTGFALTSAERGLIRLARTGGASGGVVSVPLASIFEGPTVAGLGTWGYW